MGRGAGRTGPIASALLVAVGMASPAAAPMVQEGPVTLAMTRLELDVDVDHEHGTLSGSVSYTVENRGSEPVLEVPFNLGRLMTVDGARGAGGGSLDFRQDVSTFADRPRLQVDHVVVHLASPLAPGESTRVRLDYGGTLVGYTETGSLYIHDRIDEDFSILRTDAFAWPVLGTLNARANRTAPSPDFDFRARVAVAQGYTVASGGRLVDRRTEDGTTTFTYESIAPAPFLNIPIARYEVLEQAGVRVTYFPADSAGANRVLDRAVAGLDLLARWLGALEEPPQLAIMEIPDGWGSQASLTGGIIQTADVFRDAGSGTQLYHELSHLWNPPDVDEPSARWNEGLATFLSERMADALDGRAGMDASVRRSADRLLAAAADDPALASTPFLRYGQAGMTDRSYRVGFLMFRALYEELGAERFDVAVGGYEGRHRADGATFETLMDELQERSGVDLDGFFDTWVRTTGWLDELRTGVPPERVGR